MIDDSESRRWQAVPVHPHPVVDRGQVVEHGVRAIDPALEICQDFAHPLPWSPECRNPVACQLRHHIVAVLLLQRLDRHWWLR